MMNRSPPVPPLAAIAALAAAAAVAAGCAALPPPPGAGEPRDAAVTLPPGPEREPLPPNRFVLEHPEQRVIGELQVLVARETDTFSDIARTYGLGYDELLHANPGVDPWLPGAGTPVILPTRYLLPDAAREGIVLNIASKRLYYYPPAGAEEDERVVYTYPIGIGRVGWATPTGEAKVIDKARDPHWYPPISVRKEHAAAGDPLPSVVPPGPGNPLGHRVLKLDLPGYLIHGTNQPYGVGMRVSHGCVRLYPENIEALYDMAALETPVEIVNQPLAAAWRGDELYFEAHPPLEDDERDLGEALAAMLEQARHERSAFTEDHERANVTAVVEEARGIPIRVLRRDAADVLARARLVKNVVEVDPDELRPLSELEALLAEPQEEP